MKTLMFGWEFPPHIAGGLGTACYGLTKGLYINDVEVLFVVPRTWGDEDLSFVRLKDAGDITITRRNVSFENIKAKMTFLEVGINLVPYLSPEEFERFTSADMIEKIESSGTVFSPNYKFTGGYGKNLIEEVSRYALVAAVIAAENEFDVIHAHDWLTYPAGIAAKEASGKPLVVHIHATEFDRSGDNINQLVYDIEKKGMEAADRVITVSNLTRKVVIEKYGIAPAKVITVHNAVEPAEVKQQITFNKGINDKIVTFLGRITYQKGPEYFVEAAYKVLKSNDKVHFVMAGSGDMMNKIIRRVAQLGMSNKFHFAGFLKGEEVSAMFDMSDVYVMPSVSEPFGISPLEALRSNVPVIISKQSGVSEILTHAIKVDFWDIDAMADAINGLLNYEGLPKMFRSNARKEVDSLKWENAALRVKEIYESLIKL
ncbi:MAG: glycosyltransferase [Bacteroidia bacterium]|nr:glycosyltransferase [Bacteroidia bacterium]